MFTKRKKNKYAVWPVEVEMDTALGRGNRHLTDGCFLFLFFAFIRFKEKRKRKKFLSLCLLKGRRRNMALGGRGGYCTRQG